MTTSGLDGAPLEPGEGEKDEAAVDQLLSLAAAAKKGKVPGGERLAREPKTKGLGQLLADKAQSLEEGKKPPQGQSDGVENGASLLMDPVVLRRIFASPRLGRWT